MENPARFVLKVSKVEEDDTTTKKKTKRYVPPDVNEVLKSADDPNYIPNNTSKRITLKDKMELSRDRTDNRKKSVVKSKKQESSISSLLSKIKLVDMAITVNRFVD